MVNLNMRDTPQACLTKVSFAGCHTRWRGLESHLKPGALFGSLIVGAILIL